jgi:hypothetical protein
MGSLPKDITAMAQAGKPEFSGLDISLTLSKNIPKTRKENLLTLNFG